MTGDNALPVVTTRITINGNATTIAGDGSARILQVNAPSGDLTLNGLTLTGGFNTFGDGGIFNNEATLTLNSSVVTASAAPAGGGIASGTNKPGPVGTTTLNRSQVTDNIAFAAGGGGIINHAGTLTLNSSVVSGNSGPGGGGIASGKGNPDSGESLIVLNKSKVDNNTAAAGPRAAEAASPTAARSLAITARSPATPLRVAPAPVCSTTATRPRSTRPWSPATPLRTTARTTASAEASPTPTRPFEHAGRRAHAQPQPGDG